MIDDKLTDEDVKILKKHHLLSKLDNLRDVVDMDLLEYEWIKRVIYESVEGKICQMACPHDISREEAWTAIGLANAFKYFLTKPGPLEWDKRRD